MNITIRKYSHQVLCVFLAYSNSLLAVKGLLSEAATPSHSETGFAENYSAKIRLVLLRKSFTQRRTDFYFMQRCEMGPLRCVTLLIKLSSQFFRSQTNQSCQITLPTIMSERDKIYARARNEKIGVWGVVLRCYST